MSAYNEVIERTREGRQRNQIEHTVYQVRGKKEIKTKGGGYYKFFQLSLSKWKWV